LLFSFPFILRFFNKSDFESYNIQTFTSVDQDVILQSDTDVGSTGKEGIRSEDKKAPGILFHFDPNRLDEAGWMKLGFTEKQIKVIRNYREKGGKFYKKEDLAKIYSITPAEYKRLESFIKIEPIFASKQTSDKIVRSEFPIKGDSEKKFIPAVVDINDGDTTAFIALRGIGSIFAKRIVKYRESLGGFVSVQQIREIYGLPPETFEAILPYLKISSQTTVSKLAINELDVESLSKHPYISFKQSNAIVNYRNQHGHFQSLEDLKKVILLDDDFSRKIASYLTF
jgi:DNA uptake protein ComE-like DNA-binding protein